MGRLTFVFLLILSLFYCSHVWAQNSSESANLATSNLGSVSFYLDKKNPATQGESVHVVEESKAYFCLQLNTQVPDLAKVVKHLSQVELTLEKEGENPQKIKAKSNLKRGLIYSNAQGCFIGQLRVPMGVSAGKYHVSELDLLLASEHVIPLRDHLSQVKPLGLIEVASPIQDTMPPLIEKIESWVPMEGGMNMRHSRAWKYIFFRVTAIDQNVGIDPSTFQIFFKNYLDDELVDISKAKCSTILPNLQYNCTLYFSRAEHDFYGRTLRLVLDSVSVADKYGNLTELTTPEQLEKIFGGKLMQYVFYSHKSSHDKKAETQNEPDEDGHIEASDKPKSIFINKRRDRF